MNKKTLESQKAILTKEIDKLNKVIDKAILKGLEVNELYRRLNKLYLDLDKVNAELEELQNSSQHNSTDTKAEARSIIMGGYVNIRPSEEVRRKKDQRSNLDENPNLDPNSHLELKKRIIQKPSLNSK